MKPKLTDKEKIELLQQCIDGLKKAKKSLGAAQDKFLITNGTAINDK